MKRHEISQSNQLCLGKNPTTIQSGSTTLITAVSVPIWSLRQSNKRALIYNDLTICNNSTLYSDGTNVSEFRLQLMGKIIQQFLVTACSRNPQLLHIVPVRFFFLHSHGFSGSGDAHNPVRLTRA